jgi:MoxR-like ATPase
MGVLKVSTSTNTKQTTNEKKEQQMTTKTIKVRKAVEATNRIAQVPDQKYADSYINRKVGDKTDFEWFDYALEKKRNVLIESPTGCGKTSAALAWAAARGIPAYVISFSVSTEKSTMYGKMIPTEDGHFAWQDGSLTDIVRHGGLVVLDEINAASERQLFEVHGILDKRREITLTDHKSEVIVAPDNFLVIATMNPNYEGTRELNKALRNRFAVQLTWDYDPTIEAQLVQSKALLDMASQIREEIGKGTIKTPLSTNMLVEFEEITKELGLSSAIMSFVNHFDARRERSSVKVVADTWSVNIEREIVGSKKTKKKSTGDVEIIEVDEDADLSNLGVEGVDWFYEEDQA